MIYSNRSQPRRTGVAAVEAAMVMLPLMLTLFSIFEYARFVMIRQLLDLSAEMACRYAVANNTNANVMNTSPPAGTSSVPQMVNQGLAGMNTTTHFTAAVTVVAYAQKSSGSWTPTITPGTSGSWTLTPPTHSSLISSTYSNSCPTNPTTAQLAIVSGIQPGDPIGIQVSGNFKPMFPTLLFIPTTVPISSMVIFTCEGN